MLTQLACGFRPRTETAENAQTYYLENNSLAMTATQEFALAGMQMNRVLREKDLPRKFVAYGHAFRREAGAAGADTKGIYRVHQVL